MLPGSFLNSIGYVGDPSDFLLITLIRVGIKATLTRTDAAGLYLRGHSL